ncbi:MAG: Alkaline phosphatase 3 precursor [Candidatus Heimdallarchaeota archaeon LC_2]|nr:MAG: Alkaline phosphatase 3 precursor [Candidatus Heimdallarchaeota archaeon LC_2]
MQSNFFIIGLIFIITTSPITNQAVGGEKVNNIILLIGDGMGFEQLRLASYVEYGIENGLFMQSAEFISSSISTASSNDEVTDSAASATAFASGIKTKNKYLGMDPEGNSVQTILEYAETLGKDSGLITNMPFYHATPAAFASHTNSRTNYADIREGIFAANIEIIMGGGSGFLPSDTALVDLGYTKALTKTELLSVTSTKIAGIFSSTEFSYEADIDLENEVRLIDMVSVTLDLMSQSTNGYFTMIEAGLIDFTGHDRDVPKNALETIHFDESIKLVHEWVETNSNTLVIIVADHETGHLRIDDVDDLDSQLPSDASTEEAKRQIRLTRANQINATMPTSSHSGVNVPFIAFGAGVDKYIDTSCEYNNAHIFGIMKNALDGTPPTSCPEEIPGYPNYPTVDHSSESSTSSSSNDSPFPIYPFMIALIPVLKLVKNRKYLI